MDQKRPDGTCHGKELKDAGKGTNVTQTYGGNINTGYNQKPAPFDADSDKPDATAAKNKRGA